MASFKGSDRQRSRRMRKEGRYSSRMLWGRVCWMMWFAVWASHDQPTGAVIAAWDWSDLSSWTRGGWGSGAAPTSTEDDHLEAAMQRRTFSFSEVSGMRVRDLKRHLARRHGYDAGEIGRMLDKKELIEALALEEEKARIKGARHRTRRKVQSSLLWSLAVIAVVIFWPLIRQAIDIVYVNVMVYYDRKCYEVSVCREHRSVLATAGFLCMFAVDTLQAWLSLSITLSWFLKRRWWFFPTPHLPIRPGQFMGDEIANSQAGSYGINVAPMILTWLMRYVKSKIEAWTGRALIRAQREQRKKQREAESAEERAARREAKRAAKEREAEQEALRVAQAEEAAVAAAAAATAAATAAAAPPVAPSMTSGPASLENQIPKSNVPSEGFHTSAAHEKFLSELEELASGLDELD